MTTRKTAATSGLAKLSRRGFSATSATTRIGTVPTTSSQAMRASLSSSAMRRSRRLRKNPAMMASQSFQRKISRASAVATCRPITKVRKKELGWVWALARSLHPGMSPGSSTEWPRLEMGNSSVTPCSAPMTIAWT